MHATKVPQTRLHAIATKGREQPVSREQPATFRRNITVSDRAELFRLPAQLIAQGLCRTSEDSRA